MFNIIQNVKRKPRKCISINEMVSDPGRFQFNEHIFRETNINPLFIVKLESWLRSSLDNDYKRRGLNDANQLTFYSDLDEIQQMQVVRVFSLSSFDCYYYDVSKFKSMQEFWESLSRDTGIPMTNTFIALPPLHPKQLGNLLKPADLYVKEWANSNSTANCPPAMLYVIDVKQCDCNEKIQNLPLSKTIQHFMNCNLATVPTSEWMLRELERHLHYLLSRAKKFWDCYMEGLFQYVISMEHEVILFEKYVEEISNSFTVLLGKVGQFCLMVKQCQQCMDEAVSKNI